MKKKVGVIGLGNQFCKEYLPILYKSDDLDLVAVCDIDSQKLNYAGFKEGVNTYTDYKVLLNKEKIDFAIITTPHNTHYDICSCAIRNGIHVIKEKPFAINLQDAKRLVLCSEANGVFVLTPTKMRFNPYYFSFFELRNKIGEPFYFEGKYTLTLSSLANEWRSSKICSGGGCILDMGYHMIDLMIWYFGLPDQVIANYSCSARPTEKYDVEDTATILVKYQTGLSGSLVLSRCYPPKTQFIKVVGSCGSLEISDKSISLFDIEGNILHVDDSILKTSIPTNSVELFFHLLNKEILENETYVPKFHLNHLAFIESCYISKEQQHFISPKSFLEEI